MEYIYLLGAMVSCAMLSVMSSLFGKRNENVKNISSLYNMLVTGSAFLVWGIMFLFDSGYDGGVIRYSLIYGVLYTVALMGLFRAVKEGSVSLTAFVKQLSLIAVAFWGFAFWDTEIVWNVITGIVLIIIALCFCFKPEKKGEKVVSLKWLIFASMLLVGNAGCSIVQKYQQMAFGGKFGTMLMFFATAFSAAVCFSIYMSKEKSSLKELSKGSVFCPIIGGMSSTILNLFIILLIKSPLSESVIFPCIAVGGLIITTVFSVVVYKEKLRTVQWIGLTLGAVALVFLNI